MTMMLNSSLNSASDASMPQRVDLASPGMLGNLFSPVQDKVQSLQMSTTSGPPAQPLATASLLDGWQDAPLRTSNGINSTSSISTDDASLLACSTAQQASLQPGMHVPSALISPECSLGWQPLSDPALHLLESTINSIQQQQLQEQQQAHREHQQQQELQQQYEHQQRHQQQQQQRPQAQDAQANSQWGASATVFFAGVSPIATTEALLGVFAQFGRVMSINLFKPYKGAKTSKGCGLVTFFKPSEAAHALETLNGRFVWPGARTPIVIEWCAPDRHARKQRRPAPPHAGAAQHPKQQQQLPDLMHVQHHQPMPPGLSHPLQQQQQFMPPGLAAVSQPLQVLQEQPRLLAVQFSQPPAVHFPQAQGPAALLQAQPQALTLAPELAASLGPGPYTLMRVVMRP